MEGSGGGGCGRIRWRKMWKVEVEEDVEGGGVKEDVEGGGVEEDVEGGGVEEDMEG